MSRAANIIVRFNDKDNVALALTELPLGTRLEGEGLTIRQPIPAGHKVSLVEIPKGCLVYKYGQIIGRATTEIPPGSHVHLHNLGMAELSSDYEIGADRLPKPEPVTRRRTFLGIVRTDGRVATRNYIGVLATSNCSSGVARMIAERFGQVGHDFPHVDGIVALKHGSGCAMSTDDTGFEYLQRTLSGWANHPNFAGVVMVGLGCEVNNLDCFVSNVNLAQGPNLVTLNIQDEGTPETIRRGVAAIERMLPQANETRRETVSAEHLMVGLECGGSDSYSGLTANPALGAASDLVVAHGGTVILSETSEIYGAEHLLIRRAASQDAGERLLAKIRWWEEYTSRLGSRLNNNPTPGNKEGGLTTILEKSLGAMAKAGSSKLVQVYDYAQEVKDKGMVFMDSPGYDVVSITGMVAGGANMICFTTGRGTVFGSKPVPTLKLASNTPMYKRLVSDMDLDCGPIAQGLTTVEKMGQFIFDSILETASGKKTKSETFGFGDDEFVPWQIGAVM